LEVENYIQAMEELGVPILKDAMGGNATGAYWYLLSLDPKNESRSTSQTFYTPDRPNLHLLTGNQVTRVLLDTDGPQPKVTGVEYSSEENAPRYQVSVTKEVVLAAGALHTPQLLELSGIGDSRILSNFGIDTVVDLPGVGANYQDHLLLFTSQTGIILAELNVSC
jgi:choline dehydrogenase-like flavoprotein